MLSILMAYLIGSISGASLIARLFKLPDPRVNGSNNPGATNMHRLGGKKASIATFLIDFSKALPVCMYAKTSTAILAQALIIAVFIGHLYPIYHRFKGGKGVATFLGIIFSLSLYLGLITTSIWYLSFKLTKTSALAALIAVFSNCILAYFYLNTYFLSIFLLTVFIFYKHLPNIKRLINQQELKF